MEAGLHRRRVGEGPAPRQGHRRVHLARALRAGHALPRPQPSGRRGGLRARGRLHGGPPQDAGGRLPLHAARRQARRLHRRRLPHPRHAAQAGRDSRILSREKLLEAVASVADVLAASAAESERLRTLAPATVGALESAGLLALKLPAALGGAEADPVTQIDVIEAVSALDASAGWCLMVGATTVA